jgi:NADPH:quinone reductase-like Zn-dependent oxidoreductase
MKEGLVLIRVRAFGVNRAETYFRSGAWGKANAISGLKGVGRVAWDPSGEFVPGQKVPALMGGMGRTLLHQDHLASEIKKSYPRGIDAVLDLTGNRTILDSMHMVCPNGAVCLSGFLGLEDHGKSKK